MNKRHDFYRKTVYKLISDKKVSVLVCGGGVLDKQVFEMLGFENITISNLDSRMTGDEYHPYKWRYENAECLSFPDKSFDFVVIHAAIHHATSPHKVLTEMYRVARVGILAFESRDSLVMRLLERYGFAQTYEHAAVYFNECKFGGVNNTEIPNYIYRWSEREVEKTIQSYAPCFKHKYTYTYGTAYPCTPELEKKGLLKGCLLRVLQPLYKIFVRVFPRQQNLFAFYIEKPVAGSDALLPWLLFDEGEENVVFNREWAEKNYKNNAKPSV